jgi:serine-type D-Ala-D-Ala carboxypeptidase/endopeptidase (penicillin-binding protein 4)
MKQTAAALILAGLLTGLAGCTRKTAVPAPVPASLTDSPERLRADLERIFDDPNFALALWGVEVLSLDRGDVLYSRNANKLLVPASNNKVLTGAVALVRLGPEFHWTTQVSAEGTLEGNVLRGNLWVAGAGDPSMAPRFTGGDPFRTFKDWAARLREKGVTRIEGNLIGDGRAFDDRMLGDSWEWDDLAFGYAAPISALQFNENLVTLQITPGASPGAPAIIRQSPLDDYVSLEGKVITGPSGSDSDIAAERGEVGETVHIRGTVPFGGGLVTQTIAVKQPTRYFLTALQKTLAGEGIQCSPCEKAAPERGAPLPALSPLFAYQSPALQVLLKALLKVSQNLYAESLARTLGLSLAGEGSFAKAHGVVEETLRGMAVDRGTYFYADGSGLSRRNLVSADVMVRILKYMQRHRHSAVFFDALPVAGVDGTIASRMKGTRAENNAHAKTGTLTWVRSLSGYVRTADGELLVFSMIANNFLASNRAVEYLQDSAVERLANFTRK